LTLGINTPHPLSHGRRCRAACSETTSVADDEREQAQHQARREAVPFVLTAAAVLIVLAVVSGWRSWMLIDRDLWWVWLVLAVPEFLLAAAIFGGFGRIGDAERRKRMAERLIGIVVLGSLVDLGLLLVTLVAFGTSVTGAQLLFSAFALLLTNVVAFGLAFWELDSGGPVLRALASKRELPDFQFPQDDNQELARPGWHSPGTPQAARPPRPAPHGPLRARTVAPGPAGPRCCDALRPRRWPPTGGNRPRSPPCTRWARPSARGP
jgi:hypothetical protein